MVGALNAVRQPGSQPCFAPCGLGQVPSLRCRTEAQAGLWAAWEHGDRLTMRMAKRRQHHEEHTVSLSTRKPLCPCFLIPPLLARCPGCWRVPRFTLETRVTWAATQDKSLLLSAQGQLPLTMLSASLSGTHTSAGAWMTGSSKFCLIC